MEEVKMLCNKVNAAINSNTNLSEEFKENLCTLLDLTISTLGEYDYSYFCEILSTIKIVNDDLEGSYVKYRSSDNTMLMNKSKILEDNLDIRNLFLQEVLLICTHKEA